MDRRETSARMPARLSFVTLAVRDMPAMTRFYRQFGWPEAKVSDESFVAFQTSGAVLGLYPATNYEKEFGAPPGPGLFKGFVRVNLADPSPPGWVHLFLDNHPTLLTRVEQAEAFERLAR